MKAELDSVDRDIHESASCDKQTDAFDISLRDSNDCLSWVRLKGIAFLRESLPAVVQRSACYSEQHSTN